MLNESQARFLMAVFGRLRGHLDEIEAIVTRQARAAIGSDLTPKQQRAYLQAVADIRSAVDTLVEDLALQDSASRMSSRWQITTLLNFSQVDLEELTFSKLHGYGDLDRQEYASLAERLEALRDLIGESLV